MHSSTIRNICGTDAPARSESHSVLICGNNRYPCFQLYSNPHASKPMLLVMHTGYTISRHRNVLLPDKPPTLLSRVPGQGQAGWQHSQLGRSGHLQLPVEGRPLDKDVLLDCCAGHWSGLDAAHPHHRCCFCTRLCCFFIRPCFLLIRPCCVFIRPCCLLIRPCCFAAVLIMCNVIVARFWQFAGRH